LWPEDVDLLHEIWLKMSESEKGAKLHHRDLVGLALRRLQHDLNELGCDRMLEDISTDAREE